MTNLLSPAKAAERPNGLGLEGAGNATPTAASFTQSSSAAEASALAQILAGMSDLQKEVSVCAQMRSGPLTRGDSARGD